MLTADEQSELEAAYDEAWKGTSSAAVAGRRLREIVRDAIQAQRKWAEWKHDEWIDRAYADAAKRHRRRSLETVKGAVALVAGVRAGGQNVQLALPLLTREQLLQTITTHQGHLKAASRTVAAYKRVLKVYEQHPQAKSVGEACTLAGVAIEDVLAGRVRAA